MNPERDIGLIETELILSDLETVERRRDRLEKKVRAGDAAAVKEMPFLLSILEQLGKGEWIGLRNFSAEDETWLREYQLLTAKPVVFAANVGESQEHDAAVGQAEKQQQRIGEPGS